MEFENNINVVTLYCFFKRLHSPQTRKKEIHGENFILLKLGRSWTLVMNMANLYWYVLLQHIVIPFYLLICICFNGLSISQCGNICVVDSLLPPLLIIFYYTKSQNGCSKFKIIFFGTRNNFLKLSEKLNTHYTHTEREFIVFAI